MRPVQYALFTSQGKRPGPKEKTMNVLRALQERFHDALTGLVPDPALYAAMVKPAQDARHGDYQANCAMSLGKALGGKPAREVAQTLVERLRLDDLLEPPEIAGPGFINLRLRTDWLAQQVQTMAADERLGVAPVSPPKTFVIDYSSPNVAKPMHVGHLRSTIIGDALARLLRFLGHHVVTDNHLGDWGTQFGILLYGYKNLRDEAAFRADPVRELARLYLEVRGRFKKKTDDEETEDAADPVQEACRQETAKLHAGDPENVRLWQMFMPACREEIDRIYRRLDVCFDHTLGESFYNPMLPGVVKDLLEKGIAQESEGAIIIPRGENAAPSLIRKRDGAFTYTTTDLATIQHRAKEWHPDAILYVVDFRQREHFLNLFDAARRWGCAVDVEHVSFGAVLGKDGRPLKTRAGGVPELNELLDDAVRRAAQVYNALREEGIARGEEVPELTAAELSSIYEVVGLGSVKYADLSQNRTSDYKLRSRQDDGDGRQHRDVHAVRLRAMPGHLPKRRRGPGRSSTRPAGADLGEAGGTGLGAAAGALRGSVDGRRGRLQAEFRHGLSLGPGEDCIAASSRIAPCSRPRRRTYGRVGCCCAI